MSSTALRSWGLAILFLTWVGLMSIGVSGVLAGAMQVALGAGFVAGDIPGVTYTPDRCGELEEYAPAGSSCAQAAALHHADETVTYRLAAGVLGLLVFGVWYVIRRRLAPSVRSGVPPGILASAGAGMFGIVGLALLAQGFELLVLGRDAGAGADLSAAIVSLVVAAIFGTSLYRTLATTVR